MSASDISTAVPMITEVENQIAGFAQAVDGDQRQYLLSLSKKLQAAKGFLTRPESPEQPKPEGTPASMPTGQVHKDELLDTPIPPDTPMLGVGEEELTPGGQIVGGLREAVDYARQRAAGPDADCWNPNGSAQPETE